jgi:hypothetical protein
MRKHYTIRPPSDATEVLRLNHLGKWMPDNGKPGAAFSGKMGIFPYAWYPKCKCRDYKCPAEMAMNKTCSRFGAANGIGVDKLEE